MSNYSAQSDADAGQRPIRKPPFTNQLYQFAGVKTLESSGGKKKKGESEKLCLPCSERVISGASSLQRKTLLWVSDPGTAEHKEPCGELHATKIKKGAAL